MTINVMFDLETLSTNYNAAIVQIGAVKFDTETGDIVDKFLINVSMRDTTAKGFHVDPDTVAWWNKQKPEALKSFMVNPLTLEESLHKFTSWYGSESMMTWCNGANFDFPILTTAYKYFNMSTPWKYWHVCDYRTVVNLAGVTKNQLDQKREEMGTLYHNALDDTIFQTKMLIELLK
jgi:hypothetical protein